MDVREEKQLVRKEIAQLKRSYSLSELDSFSVQALARLEKTEVFGAARCVALYHAIPGEVQTAAFIEKWYKHKQILLPVIVQNELQLRLYVGKEALTPGAFGILEPKADDADIPEMDLIIIPGLAFDRQLNRLGRGKGYYDRLLSGCTAHKAGLCFHFQLLDEIPTELFDKKMDFVVTDKETI